MCKKWKADPGTVQNVTNWEWVTMKVPHVPKAEPSMHLHVVPEGEPATTTLHKKNKNQKQSPGFFFRNSLNLV